MGNVTELTDEAGAVVARYRYSAYGKLIEESGVAAGECSFRFSTKYWDAEVGLYWYGYRYYSAELGRWLTRDPIEDRGSVNLYEAFRGNPEKLLDPLGSYDLPITPEYYQEILAGLRKGTASRQEIVEKVKSLIDKFITKRLEYIEKSINEMPRFVGEACAPISITLFTQLTGKSFDMPGTGYPKLLILKHPSEFRLPIFIAGVSTPERAKRQDAHGFNAIFIGKAFTRDEMRQIKNWLFLEYFGKDLNLYDPTRQNIYAIMRKRAPKSDPMTLLSIHLPLTLEDQGLYPQGGIRYGVELRFQLDKEGRATFLKIDGEWVPQDPEEEEVGFDFLPHCK
jgi:RHS repeat-associated protein